MNKILVCMDYTQDGKRTITDLYFDVSSNDFIGSIAKDYAGAHDETYIVDFDPNYEPFINEIVTKGCRL